MDCDKYRRGTGSSSEAACHILTWGPMVRVRGSTDGNCQASPTGYLLAWVFCYPGLPVGQRRVTIGDILVAYVSDSRILVIWMNILNGIVPKPDFGSECEEEISEK